MGHAILNGRPFRIDPSSISWDYSVNVSEHQTIGGRVVQIFGAKIGDFVIEGAFGVGGWEEQQTFLEHMEELGRAQLDHSPKATSQPFRFVWPEQGWDFQVYLKSYDENGGRSVSLTNENINPKWRLVFFIVEDNALLTTIAADTYLSRLAAGLGWRADGTSWRRSTYNGPLDASLVAAELKRVGATTVEEYLSLGAGFDLPGAPGAPVTAGTSPTTNPNAPVTPGASPTNSPTSGLPADINLILATIRHFESSNAVHPDGNYTVTNAHASASGAYQFVDGTWQNLLKQYKLTGPGHAANAPPALQDQVAGLYVQSILTSKAGNVRAVPLTWYTGSAKEGNTVPSPGAGNRLTPTQYADQWMAWYVQRVGANNPSGLGGVIRV